MKNQKGFSLIELLIVVVIIGIIAAIAIPNLLASRRSANEGSAISSLRTYHGAQATYSSTYGNGNFAGVPSVTASGTKSGYTFAGHSDTRTAMTPACHLAQAYPTTSSGAAATGTRIFVITTPGVMHAGSFTGAAGWGPGNCDIAVGIDPLAQ